MDASSLQQQVLQQQAQLAQLSEQLAQEQQLLAQEQQLRQRTEQQLSQQQLLQALRVPKPPETDGSKPTPEHWAQAMEVFAAEKGLNLDSPEACRFAATFLRDAALDWYTIYQLDVTAGRAAPFSSWQQFKTTFLQRFSPFDTSELARRSLDRLVQTRSVAEYAQRFTRLMLQLPSMDAGTRVHDFIRGLKPAVQVEVALHQPSSLDSAISLAMAADNLLFSSGFMGSGAAGSSSGNNPRYRRSSTGFSGSRPFASGAPNNTHTNGPTPMELGGMRQQQQQQHAPTPSGASGSRPYCTWCQRPGHHTRDCRRRASNFRSQHDAGCTGRA
jgi:hypothetical protein